MNDAENESKDYKSPIQIFMESFESKHTPEEYKRLESLLIKLKSEEIGEAAFRIELSTVCDFEEQRILYRFLNFRDNIAVLQGSDKTI